MWILFVLQAFAFDIPKNLNADQRSTVVHLLGFNTSTKILSNPLPLGGFSGVEVGLAFESISLGPLAQQDLQFPSLSLGKGLFENIDSFIHFVPPIGKSRISEFGALFRWSFFQSELLPINLSLIAHADQIGIKDSFSTQSYGFQMVAGINVEDLSIFLGAGYLTADANFTGGNSGDGVVDPSLVDPNSNTLHEHASTIHSVLGLTYHHDIYFIAGEVDRYHDFVYSAKAGVRF